MSGPIVRTGTTPEYWKNWDSIFGEKKTGKKGSDAKAAASKPAKKSAKAAAKKTSKKKK